jgi:choline dehydrogenase-like flavoprotein
MAIDLRPGGACVRSKTCDGFPCPRWAKGDAETCGIEPALASGHARLETGVRVRRVVTSGRRVTRVEGDGVEVTGGRFVLAAGAANSAALLLASGNLANGSDQVGRNFMMHNNAHIAAIDVSRRNDVTFQKTLSVNDWYLDGGDGFPLGMMKTAAPRAVPRPVLDLVAGRSVEWLIMAEDLPAAGNRVLVDGAGRITTARVARNTATHARLMKRAKGLLRAAGYDAILTQRFDIAMNSHMCGTVVAGADPATSVLDPWCKAHDLENLWVIDGGFFPSSAAMNPALTIAAQALRAVAESDLAG